MATSQLALPAPRPPELVIILDFEDASLAFFHEMSLMNIVDEIQTPFEYAVSMVPHWTWVDLALRIVYDMLTLHPSYFQYFEPTSEPHMTYEMLIELTNHPDIKATMYDYREGPLGTLYYRPKASYDVEVAKQSMDEIVVNDLEEVLLQSLADAGVDTDPAKFRLYTTTDLQSCAVHSDVAIWRFLVTVFTQVVRAVQGIGYEYGLQGRALAQYRVFQPALPIRGAQSEYLYAVTIREE